MRRKLLTKIGNVFKKALSLVLAFVMVLGMVPLGLTASAAEGEINIQIHFYSEPAWGWTPALQYWGGTDTQVSGYKSGPTEITGWGGAQGYVLTPEADEGWYTITLQGDFTGFQFLDMSNPNNNTAGKGYNPYMTQFTGDEPVDLYCKYNGETNYDTVWYTDAECTTQLQPPADLKTYPHTVYFSNPNGWTDVYAYAWDSNGSEILGSWPGTQISEEDDYEGWYRAEFTSSETGMNVIFNNNSGSQTDNLSVAVQGDGAAVRAWVSGNAQSDVSYDEPQEEKPSQDYYLFGYINGANYACEEDYQNLGKFKFVDGEQIVTFEQDSYVAVKTGDNQGWYMTDGWLGEVTEATLYSTSVTGANSNKLQVPAGTHLMTLVDNGDDTFTLSYETLDYYLFGYINGADYACEADSANMGKYRFQDGKLTVEFDQTSYVAVKLTDNLGWYMTDGWLGETTEAKLYNTNVLSAANKLQVPAGEVTFTLKGSSDDTMTLSYEVAGEDVSDVPVGGVATVCDLVQVNIADKLYTLQAFTGGIYECTAEIPSGKFTAQLVVNGESTDISCAGTSDGSVTLQLQDGVLTQVDGATSAPADGAVSIIGEVRNADTWVASATGWEFSKISDTIYRYQMVLDAGTYPYKAVFNYASWYEKEGTGNRILTLNEKSQVIFLYDTETGYLYDSVNNPFEVAKRLGMSVPETKFSVIDNADGTTTFVALGENGQSVKLYYGEAVNSMTCVDMGNVASGKCTSEPIFLGDEALDLYYYYEIDGVRTLDGSNPTVTEDGAEYSNYTRKAFPGRAVNVPGTFPGPSWDAASNQMTYLGNGLYEYTFENVPAAKYEYKISMGSWAENYGADGQFDGANIAVTVPLAQDVTVWYNDFTHKTVTSLVYEMNADITLSGTGIPEGTKLTDPGLSGIYSVTVKLTAGTYSDLKLRYGGQEVTFSALELTKDKEVTFLYDPSTGLASHNGSDSKVSTENIFYDTHDSQYKSLYGAVATGEEVTFSIDTGVDAVSVSLVVKGQKGIPMERDGEAADGVQRWKCTTSFAALGEYEYFFAISNGSDLMVYCDDDSYYGTGKTVQLGEADPYDLVVYQSEYETPDWMKNAVIYQIFPDRFFDGDESNNQAQLSARGDVDYEFIEDWYTLPENPDQENLLSQSTYESTGAWFGDGEWSNEIYGGDLQGIVERIDYLKALGVNVIYLNPVFASISNHRYDACDYTQIDPILGTEGDFAELVKVAEENGMHIILDGVFNHVSDDSVYFDRYYKFLGTSEKIGAYPYWAYVYDYMSANDAVQADAEQAAKTYFTEIYGITDYSYTEWFEVYQTQLTDADGNAAVDDIGLRAGKPVYGYEGWWGYDSMPVIKSTNGSEYQSGNWAEEIICNEDGSSVTQYWISQGNNGWRLDVANEVSDETWQNFRESVKSLDSDAVIIGEIWDDATKYLMGDMYDSVMNYEFRRAVLGFVTGVKRNNSTDAVDNDYTAEEVMKDMERLRERYPEEAFYAMMNLVDSHDTARVLSYLDGILDDRKQTDLDSAFPTYEGTGDTAKKQQYLVAFLQFTYAGAPTIYYGDEIGMVGADDPDDRRAFEWGQGEQALVEWYAELAAIRASYTALRTGSVEPISGLGGDLLGYVRRDSDNALAVVANRTSAGKTVALNLAELGMEGASSLTDLISGAVYPVADGAVSVEVSAYLGVILTENVEAYTVDTAALAPAYDESYVVTGRHMHNFEASETVAPTCTEQGYTTYICGEDGETAASDYVAPNGHTWGQWKQTKAPTATEEGQERRDCENCDAFETRSVAATGEEPTDPTTPSEPEKPCDGGEYCPGKPYSDLNPKSWYHEATDYVIVNGIMKGYSAGVFAPGDALSRAMMVQILYNLDGGVEVSGKDSFTDTIDGKWYTDAIAWAVQNNIIQGYGDGTFRPNDPVTREQMVTMLYRYGSQHEKVGATASLSAFADAKQIHTYALNPMQWAVGSGLIIGVGKQMLNPSRSATRAEAAQLLTRYCKLA